MYLWELLVFCLGGGFICSALCPHTFNFQVDLYFRKLAYQKQDLFSAQFSHFRLYAFLTHSMQAQCGTLGIVQSG